MSNSFIYSDFVPENWPRNRRLRIIGALDDQSILEIREGDYDTLWIDSSDSTTLDNIPIWRPDISRLKISACSTSDVSWVGKLSELTELHLSGRVVGDINFANLKNLKSCNFDFNSTTTKILESTAELAQLTFSGLKLPLAEFPARFCRSIKVLGLDGGDLESLAGIESFQKLESLSLMNLRRLHNISMLGRCTYLKEIDITSCNNISAYSVIGSLPSLEWLGWDNNQLDSLHSFLPGKNIEVLLLGQNTTVLDSDIQCALLFPKLKHIQFKNRRGYGRKALDLNKELAKIRPGRFKTLAERQLERLR